MAASIFQLQGHDDGRRQYPDLHPFERAGADPTVASSVFVTMVTDSMGFLVFLGLATAAGLVG